MNEEKSALRHVVMFRFKDGTGAEQIETIAQNFKGLKAHIPEIREFEWGWNVSVEDRDQGLTHIFCVTFSSVDGREAYRAHPAHCAFADSIRPSVEKVVVLDYWATI